MENMEVMVRGLVMQNPGLGFGSVSFQGVQLLWVVVVATIVLALVSVTRVSVVSVGWTWGSKPGHVRVRVQSFSSLLEDGIGHMFSAEILNCSADSCSEDASSSVSDSKSAEMVFVFDRRKVPSLVTTTTLPRLQPAPEQCVALQKIVRKRSKSLDFPKKESLQRSKSLDLQTFEATLLLDWAPLLLDWTPQPTESVVSRPRRKGIGWDVSPASSLSSCGVETDLLQSLANSTVHTAPPLPSRVVENTSSGEWEFDPLLRLKVRDAVVSDGRSFFSVEDFTFPSSPVAIQGSSLVTLKDDVVRFWDSDTKSLTKSVRLSKGGDELVTAFDVNWESEVVGMATKGGLVSIVNLESAAYANCYETQQSVVQAVHFNSNSFSKTMFTGGPAAETPGCVVALWDSRSSRRELILNLASASAIYCIRSHGEELYVKDEAGSLSAHDMRMLGASTLTRVPCEVKLSSAPEDRWWDDDATVEEEDDIDDDFVDCQTTEQRKRGGATSMSSLVTVMSRSFSSKALTH